MCIVCKHNRQMKIVTILANTIENFYECAQNFSTEEHSRFPELETNLKAYFKLLLIKTSDIKRELESLHALECCPSVNSLPVDQLQRVEYLDISKSTIKHVSGLTNLVELRVKDIEAVHTSNLPMIVSIVGQIQKT